MNLQTDKIHVEADDVFILGNVSALALEYQLGEKIEPILSFLKLIRPLNAGPFLLEAQYLEGQGKTAKALSAIEQCKISEAEQNKEQAAFYHLHLTHKEGLTDQLIALGEAYLEKNLFTEPDFVHVVTKMINAAKKEQGLTKGGGS
ncbi:hypothetical protein [uncultured Tateyamaria sp.]|uniref:hypothetical protein n=1 Tax=uncultured Tateyamaria sp. TaxID=455651 RepID=UPI00261E414B|nr:hypothetical protein [uncultured Tateyamaria sp.]